MISMACEQGSIMLHRSYKLLSCLTCNLQPNVLIMKMTWCSCKAVNRDGFISFKGPTSDIFNISENE